MMSGKSDKEYKRKSDETPPRKVKKARNPLFENPQPETRDPQPETRDPQPATKPPAAAPAASPAPASIWDDIIVDIKNDEYLANCLREDWETDPRNIDARLHHLCGMDSNEYVGLEMKPQEMLSLFYSRAGRPPLGMLNACSGSGKSALMQYCEREINADDDFDGLALAVTFNGVSSDLNMLNANQGLVMRIVERFLLKRRDASTFTKFRDLWLANYLHLRIDIDEVIKKIQDLLLGDKDSKQAKDQWCSKQKLLLLVDEPGLAGGEKRTEDNSRVTFPETAFDLTTRATQLYRVSEKYVRFIFSSLKPIYLEKRLVQETSTGGKVVWIDVPYFSQTTSRDSMQQRLDHRLQTVKALMPDRDYKLVSDLIITMASGHWSTFDSIVRHLTGDEGVIRKIADWMSTLYYENVRNVVVQATDDSSKYEILNIPQIYRSLVMMAILGIQVHPFEDGLCAALNTQEAQELGKKKGMMEIASLNDMAYRRIVQNKIGANEGSNTFRKEVPHLSLLDVRKWCLKGDVGVDRFRNAIWEALASAGYDPTKEHKQERLPLGIAFERTSTALLHAKFLAWQEFHELVPGPSEQKQEANTIAVDPRIATWLGKRGRDNELAKLTTTFPGGVTPEFLAEIPARIYHAMGVQNPQELISFAFALRATDAKNGDSKATPMDTSSLEPAQAAASTTDIRPGSPNEGNESPFGAKQSYTTQGAKIGTKKDMSLEKFFGGTILSGERDFTMKAPSIDQRSPGLFYIEGSGGFRSNQRKEQPQQLKDEENDRFKERKSKWLKEALEQLKFSERVQNNRLCNGDIICPGAKNQPHSDAIIIAERKLPDGPVPALIFEQMKYSEGDSSTKLGASHIIEGLKRLVNERGLLYGVTKEVGNLGNQISALEIQERNVVYFWNVSRSTVAIDELKGSVFERAERLGFKGSILIANCKDDPSQVFGRTFKDLALLNRSQCATQL